MIADSSMPWLETVQWRPPSVDTPTPPRNRAGSVRRHIFGRGRSCVPLKPPHIRSFTSGSNASQYVVLRQRVGMPVEEPVQVSPPSSLRKRPMSVYGMNTRCGSCGSNWIPYVVVTSRPRVVQRSFPRDSEFTCAQVFPPSVVR